MKNLFILIILTLTLCTCQEQTPGYPQRQPPAGFLEQPVRQAAGHQLFLDKCAYCHGTFQEGRMEQASFFVPPASDFTDGGYHEIDPAYLYHRIAKGKTEEPFFSRGSVMPGWEPYFTAEQIWELVAYLRFRSRAVQ